MFSMNGNLSGVINIYKEKGYTSHDVVNIVRKKFSKIKTGHTGTLDPDATGVLPICIGKATKLADYIMCSEKEYKAVVSLGKTTTTQDFSGEILSEREVTSTREDIEDVVKGFVGEISQIPPMYSAIKINGRKLYELAREGKEVERKQRNITIHNITIDNFIDNKNFEITVSCSKGTYIRTLCNDIGEKLKCGAYMKELVRSKSGVFHIENSIKLDELDKLIKSNNISSALIDMDKILMDYPKYTVSNKASKFLYNGNKISLNYVINNNRISDFNKIVVYDENNVLIGIYEVFNDYIKPLTMLI